MTTPASISAPIVMRGKVYSIGRYKPGTPHEQEQVVCVDANTGQSLWMNRHNMFLAGVPAERIGWSSVVGDPTTGRVYSQGTNCVLQCIDGETGKTIWEHSLVEEFGFLSVYGGRTNFPMVFEDLVIVSSVTTGWGDRIAPAHRFVAFDKNTGEVRWANAGTNEKPEDTTYSTPTLAVIDGQWQFIVGSSDGAVWAFQPRTGQPLWNYRMSRRGLRCRSVSCGRHDLYGPRPRRTSTTPAAACCWPLMQRGGEGRRSTKSARSGRNAASWTNKSSPIARRRANLCGRRRQQSLYRQRQGRESDR